MSTGKKSTRQGQFNALLHGTAVPGQQSRAQFGRMSEPHIAMCSQQRLRAIYNRVVLPILTPHPFCGDSFMSFINSDDDSQQRFALGFLFGLIALIVSTVVGVVVYQRGIAHGPKTGDAAVTSQAVMVPVMLEQDFARVVVQDGVVKFYFASAKAELAEGANDALAGVVKGVADGQKAVVSGFHDTTGNAAQNAELAKQRAIAVRDALTALNVPAAQIELKKPEKAEVGGDNAQARRVEVILVP